jgi:sugar/nucleoside kinase (ribokinase family)
MPFDLITIGDTSIDQFTKIDDASVFCDINHHNCQICLDYGDKIHVDSFEASIGGNSPNTGIACSKLGLNTAIYTELGDDANAEICLAALKEDGVDTKYCNINKNTPTNVHAIIIFQSERTILSYHEERDYKLPTWENPKWIYYSSLAKGFEKFQQELVDYINKNPNIMVAVNPGTYQMKQGLEAQKNILEITDVLFVNKQEAEELTQTQPDELDFKGLHKKLQKLGPKLTVVTNNENGSTAYDGHEYVEIGIYKTGKEPVDKTGAGDSYAAGFLSALHYGKGIEDAAKWGAINSASVITQPGATKGILTKKEIENAIKKFS